MQSINTFKPNLEESHTNQIQKHKPNSYSCYTKCEIDSYSKLEIYTGEDSAEKLVEYI